LRTATNQPCHPLLDKCSGQYTTSQGGSACWFREYWRDYHEQHVPQLGVPAPVSQRSACSSSASIRFVAWRLWVFGRYLVKWQVSGRALFFGTAWCACFRMRGTVTPLAWKNRTFLSSARRQVRGSKLIQASSEDGLFRLGVHPVCMRIAQRTERCLPGHAQPARRCSKRVLLSC